MPDQPHIEINVFALTPTDPATRAVAAPDWPAMFAAHHLREQDVMVTAVLAGQVVGSGRAWLFEPPGEPHGAPLLMWVRSAEVEAPYRTGGLLRTLIDALLQAGKQMGVGRAYIDQTLRDRQAEWR
jgi:hypothetical protein